MFAGLVDRRRREIERDMSLAWHIEWLARQEKLPRLAAMLGRLQRSASKQKKTEAPDWQAQYAAFAGWAKSFRKE